FPLYVKNHPLFQRVLDFVAENPLESLENGKHEIQGKDCFVIVAEYETKPVEKSIFEAHRKYLDIQVMLYGEERMGILPLSLTTPGTYEPDRDFLPISGNPDLLRFPAGFFMIFHPQDAHMPGVQTESGISKVRKAVFKVAL